MTETKIVFLGTGDAFNTDGFANQAIIIESGESFYLVDCGPTTLYRMKRMKLAPEGICGIFITHFHGDHTAGLPSLILYLKLKARATTLPFIAGPKGIKARASALFEAAFRGEGLSTGIRFMEIPWESKKSAVTASGIETDVFTMKHRPESLGYRLYSGSRIISVTGDTGINKNIFALFDSANAGIIECSSLAPEKESHTSMQELVAILDSLSCDLVIPIHGTEETRKELERISHPKIRVVEDGSVVTL